MVELLLMRTPDAVVRITEDLKMENAREFYEDFLAIHEPGVENVYLDFREVRFVDSSGIGILLKCEKDLKAKGANITVFWTGKIFTFRFQTGRSATGTSASGRRTGEPTLS